MVRFFVAMLGLTAVGLLPIEVVALLVAVAGLAASGYAIWRTEKIDRRLDPVIDTLRAEAGRVDRELRNGS